MKTSQEYQNYKSGCELQDTDFLIECVLFPSEFTSAAHDDIILLIVADRILGNMKKFSVGQLILSTSLSEIDCVFQFMARAPALATGGNNPETKIRG